MKHRLRRTLVRLVILLGCTFVANRGFAQKPNSYIVLPIQVQLQPLFAAAEASVDTVFTSSGWPDGWVEADCATRYKYRFRRQPLRFSAVGNRLHISFAGLYQIVGSTRGCVRGTVISPWTPACKCGFDEGERRVEVGFIADVQITPNYQLITTVKRLEPKPADKCTVCFWGQDITAEVMKGLKAELDLSVKTMTASFGRIDMRPFVTQAWNRLAAPYPIAGLGTFHLQPSAISLQQLSASGNLLNLTLGLAAAPQVNIQPGGVQAFPLPNLGKTTAAPGFVVNIDAALPYDSLSAVVTGAAKGKRIEVSEGLIKKHIIIQDIRFAADTAGKLAMYLGFNGSFSGTVQFTGYPRYNPTDTSIVIDQLEYSLQSKSWLLNTAKWLFNKSFVKELKKYSSIPLQPLYDTATTNLNGWLNKEWTTGVRGSGAVERLAVNEIKVAPLELALGLACRGRLAVSVTPPAIKF